MLLHVAPQDFVLDGRAGFRRPPKACVRVWKPTFIGDRFRPGTSGFDRGGSPAHLPWKKLSSSRWLRRTPAGPRNEPRSRCGRYRSGIERSGGVRRREADFRFQHPVTADHFTRDIAWMLKVSGEDAESLKQQYGCAMLG